MNSNEEIKTDKNTCCEHGRRRFLKVPFFVAFIVLAKSALVLFLWNKLIPDLFHGPSLSYLQALELMVLAKLLVGFGGFRHFGGRHGGHMWKARWAAMSPEERENLRKDIRSRWKC